MEKSSKHGAYLVQDVQHPQYIKLAQRLLNETYLFNFEGFFLQNNSWGYSSVGRAPALHAGGQEFESLYLHHEGL